MEEQQESNKINAKQILNFCYGFFGVLLVIGALSLWEWMYSDGFYGAVIWLGSIPLAVIGFILWRVIRNKNKSLAIGLLLGCMAPFTYLFLITKGCGIFS